jgi:Protein of unknown function (DUF2809)
MNRTEGAPRPRLLYASLLLLTITAGLASRRWPDLQPDWVARYGGDILWATMVFWLLALGYVRARTLVLGVATLGIAWTVEVSQLIHLPWLDTLRASRAGGLILGQGFLWSDLWCYVVGAGIAIAVDHACRPD